MKFGGEKMDWKRRGKRKQKKERYRNKRNLTRKSKVSCCFKIGDVTFFLISSGLFIQMYMDFIDILSISTDCLLSLQIISTITITFIIRAVFK